MVIDVKVIEGPASLRTAESFYCPKRRGETLSIQSTITNISSTPIPIIKKGSMYTKGLPFNPIKVPKPKAYMYAINTVKIPIIPIDILDFVSYNFPRTIKHQITTKEAPI